MICSTPGEGKEPPSRLPQASCAELFLGSIWQRSSQHSPAGSRSGVRGSKGAPFLRLLHMLSPVLAGVNCLPASATPPLVAWIPSPSVQPSFNLFDQSVATSERETWLPSSHLPSSFLVLSRTLML